MSKKKEVGLNEEHRTYRDGLDKTEKARYLEKLKIIDGHDPYELDNMSDSVDILPSISDMDIAIYLINTPSPYTLDDLRCHKSMDAYNYFLSGWVRDKKSMVFGENVAVTAKVMHSQRLREKPLLPWVIAGKTGNIKAAHCNCMAGLGEACSHVAALLFAVKASVELRESVTVTQKPAYWMLPGEVKKIQYSEIRDIDFTSSKTLKKNLENNIECVTQSDQTHVGASKLKVKTSAPSTDVELRSLFEKLHFLGTKSVVLATIDPYCNDFVPKPVSQHYPSVLTELREGESCSANFRDLSIKCKSVQISVTEEQAKLVEKETRLQSKTKLWNRFRAGRITASKAKSVCDTDINNPSVSLIKTVCYPESVNFTNAATRWGSDHEKVAIEKLISTIELGHENVVFEDSGLVLNPKFPYMGASPDGIISCDCCGKFCVEVKCPYSKKDEKLNDISDKNFYLHFVDGQLTLKKNHQYYYQIQTQLGMSNLENCYFVVWTNVDLHVEVVEFNLELWHLISEKSHKFFRNAVLPELVGKFYTRIGSEKPVSSHSSVLKPLVPLSNTTLTDINTQNSDTEEKWCYCDQVEFGSMICCDNQNCEIQWFHYNCVGVENPPKGKWHCPDCRKLKSKAKRPLKNAKQ